MYAWERVEIAVGYQTREEDRADLFGDCWPVQARVMLMRQHGS